MSNHRRVDQGNGWIKLLVLGGAVGVVVAAFVAFRGELTLDRLATHEAALREYQRENPVSVYLGAFLLYVLVTGVSLPGAVPLSLAYGWYFGFVRAVVLVSFASTAGATLAFLFSRYLLRDAIQGRFGPRLEAFNRALDREGAFYLFTLRLIPIVPFFVINVVMGLTKIPTRTFWWVSQVGMLAGTMVYVYAGASIPTLAELADASPASILTPKLFIAFALLGLFPLVVKKIVGRLRPMPVEQGEHRERRVANRQISDRR